MPEPDRSALRILLVDDDEDDYVFTRDLLADSDRSVFTLDWLADFDEAAQSISRGEHDLYLIDYRLGARDGLELLRHAAASGCTRPLILLTGQADREIDMEAMRAGAADYLVKGRIDAQLLERSIRYALQQGRALQALRESEERLMHDAFHDALTQLPNRALFMDRLQRAMEAQKRHHDAAYAVLFLDLDRFKVVNDSLGHGIGDQLLIAVAERLHSRLRASDTVARLGGDEFAVLVEEIHDAAGAVRAARRIHDDLLLPFVIGTQELFTTVSIGIAVGKSDYERPEDVLRDADIAMYRAKGQGKARHEIFDAAMHAHVLDLLQFETDLRRAIDRGELRVYYQPIVSMASGRVCGVEALVRWQRGPELIGADAIIAVAEETGLIVPIGDWVLRESLRQLGEWDRAGIGGGTLDVHVNLSPRQLLHRDVVERVRQALRDSGIEAKRLHLEVTESVLIESADAAAALLRDLRATGVGLSLDDFGTGYSSLSSLRQFPFDILKIDRSFLHDADARRGDEIVRTISSLARLLGLEVTVEGLETAAQTDRMRSLSLDYAQGFYFSLPLPPDEVAKVLGTQFGRRGGSAG